MLLDDGTALSAGTVVLAAGAWSGELADVPVRPVKGQTLRLRLAGPARPSRVVRATVQGTPVYVVPRGDGRLVVGASSEEAGFDLSPRAGAVYELLRDAQSVVPELSEASLERGVHRPTARHPRQRAGDRTGLDRRAGARDRPLPQRDPADAAHGRRDRRADCRRHRPGRRGALRVADGDGMSIELNGEPREVAANITLLALIEQHAGTTRGSAVVVDGAVVPRAKWPTTVIEDGQRIELIRAVQGG